MRLRVFPSAGMLMFASFIVACSGGGGGTPGGGPPGGGGATPTPHPSSAPSATPSGAASVTPTPVPKTTYVLPSPSPVSQSVYSIDSNPHGLAVLLDGTSLGMTPQTTTPAFANTPHIFQITPNAAATPNASASPFVVTVTQTANGPRTIFYNQILDTLGKITKITTTSASRRPQFNLARAAAFGARRLPISILGRPRYSSNRIAVTYDTARLGSRTFASIERAHGSQSALTMSQSPASVTRVLTLASGRSVDAAMRGLASEVGVASVSRVGLRYPMASPGAPVYPNDTYFADGEQWYLSPVIDMPDAWAYTLGNPSVAVAIVDSGYDPNQTEVAPQVTVAEQIIGGYISKAAPPGAVSDTDGHGTFVSAVVSASTNNAAGFAGVGYGVSLQEYQIYTGSNPVADTADEAEAIREAVANGAKIILVPLGGASSAGPDPLERDAVDYALANNVTVVAAAGNESATTLDYPAALQGVISVGASAVNDTATPGTVVGGGNFEYVPTYSNVDPNLDLVAPGGDPSSAADPDVIHWIKNSYTTTPAAGLPACPSGTATADCGVLIAGTSPSSAQAAGVAALMLSLNPALTPATIQTILDSTADQIVNATSVPDPRQGHGRLNAHRAMVAVAGDPAPVPALPAPAFTQFRAFAYTNSGATTPVAPTIVDVTFPFGAPVNVDGTFRIADIPAIPPGKYKIGVWIDTNGDGVVDAGDYFGAVTNTCSTTGPCSGATTITAALVTSGYKLP
jgi:uncharacterized Zn-binding protein involved in type VI secretion